MEDTRGQPAQKMTCGIPGLGSTTTGELLNLQSNHMVKASAQMDCSGRHMCNISASQHPQ